MKKLAAVLVLVAAVGVWCWRLGPTTPTESELRETDGITAEVLATRLVPQGVEVTCRVSNATANRANQIVLCVTVSNEQGQTLASNPLVGVADLAAGKDRNATILVPFQPARANVTAQVKVSLVRWQ